MKFVHIADMHFDSPFTGLNVVDNLGDIRRLEQREVFRKIIDYIQKNAIDYLLIAGDLYEQQYIRKSTIEFINNQFETIKNTKVFIAPGNHDPYVKNSYYDSFQWSQNVHICKHELERIEEPEVDIYVTAFTNFFQNESPIEKMEIKNANKCNLLLTHCDLNGRKDQNRFCLSSNIRISIECFSV